MTHAVVAAALAACLAAGAWWLVVRLPEPDDGPAESKPSYRSLARPGAVVLTVVAAALLAAAGSRHPLGWALVAWAGIGTVLVLVDALTTWLPRRVQYLLDAALVPGLAIAVLGSGQPGGRLASTVLGSLAAGALFWLVWRLSAGMGFGDVRLAFALGALGGAGGWGFWWTSLLAGTLLGAVVGVVAQVRRRSGPAGTAFAYGPSLWAGPWIAVVLGGGLPLP